MKQTCSLITTELASSAKLNKDKNTYDIFRTKKLNIHPANAGPTENEYSRKYLPCVLGGRDIA